MHRIYLVRHGEASSGIEGHVDPGLSEKGRQQAEQAAAELSLLNRIPVFSSPLARAQETAIPLCKKWHQTATIEKRIAEIPFANNDLRERAVWLRGVMKLNWQELPDDLLQWRERMIGCLLEQPTSCVMYSHLVAINILVGAATDTDALISFRPDNCSITEFEVSDAQLKLVQRGSEAITKIN